MPHPTSRTAGSTVAALLCAVLAACGPGQTPAPPDISAGVDPGEFLGRHSDRSLLVVSFDAMRADALGAYGNTRGATPTMDAFAAEGLVFDHAYTAGQATPTSFAAAYTGRYPFSSFRKWHLIETTTLAETFRAAGFRTAGFMNNRQLDPERNFDQGYDTYEVFFEPDEGRFVEHAFDWLRANRGDRFYMWIHFISPHSPYSVRQMSTRFYDPDYDGDLKQQSGPLDDLVPVNDPAVLERLHDLYTGEVFFADALFAKILAVLDELELAATTTVVLTADHGEEFMEHGTLGHKQVYEEVVRVPLIIRAPGADGGRRTDRPVCNLDFLPTFATMIGQPVPDGLDGASWFEPHDPQRHFLYSVMTNHRWYAMGMRLGDYKLIVRCTRPNPGVELYDLAADPLERNNIDRSQAARSAHLIELMAGIAGGHPCDVLVQAIGGAAETQGLDDEAIRQLKSLGYVR